MEPEYFPSLADGAKAKADETKEPKPLIKLNKTKAVQKTDEHSFEIPKLKPPDVIEPLEDTPDDPLKLKSFTKPSTDDEKKPSRVSFFAFRL